MTDDEKRIELLTKWNVQMEETVKKLQQELEEARNKRMRQISLAEEEAAVYRHATWSLAFSCFVLGLIIGKILWAT